MEKIKAFFMNKYTRIVCSVMLVLGLVGLLIGGITQEEINGVVVAVVAAVSAVALVIKLVCDIVNSGGKDEKLPKSDK